MGGRPLRTLTLLPLLLAPALAGCINLGLGAAKTPPALLTLSAEAQAPEGAAASGRAGQALSVMEPETPASLAVLRVPVTIDASHLAYLKKAQWVERPSRLFQHLLAETLRAQNKGLVSEGDALTRGPILAGRLGAFGYDAASGAVVVRFDAVRTAPDGTQTTRRFEAHVDHVAADAGAVGPALNAAANTVAKDVAAWAA